MGCRHSLNAARENRHGAKLAKFAEGQKTEILANLAQLTPWRFALGSNRKLATYTRKISNQVQGDPTIPATSDYSSTLAKLKELSEALPQAMRKTVEHMLSEQMEGEISAQIGARHQERSVDRLAHRNGYRQRALETQLGRLNVRIPRVLTGRISRVFSSRAAACTRV